MIELIKNKIKWKIGLPIIESKYRKSYIVDSRIIGYVVTIQCYYHDFNQIYFHLNNVLGKFDYFINQDNAFIRKEISLEEKDILEKEILKITKIRRFSVEPIMRDGLLVKKISFKTTINNRGFIQKIKRIKRWITKR